MEKGTVVDPTGSNASYYMGQNINFSQVTVYSQTVNFSYTNVTTTADEAVNITMWKHNFSNTDGDVALYNYNVSANTTFHELDSNLQYEVYFNGSLQRVEYNQVYLNITVPASTNLTVREVTNSAPNAPSNPSPSDGSTDISSSPTLSVDVSDPDGDSLNVYFFDGSDNLIGKNTGVSNGSTTSLEWSGRSPGTTYNWYVKVSDTYVNTTGSTWSFTTNYPPSLTSDSQFYTDYSVNHEFEVEAYANDTDGESDFSTCKIYYDDSDGNSGLLNGNLVTSYGDTQEVKCNSNISSSISGLEVGESVSTSVRFSDGTAWANTSLDTHTIPNTAPTAPTSFTNLGSFLTDHTPSIQWQGEDDPDGDSMTLKAYTNTSSNPSTLDNSGSAGLTSLDLGSSVNLQDNTTYFYRLQVCDQYGKCSGYTSDKQFNMNEEPVIESHKLNDSNIVKGDTVEIETDVDDQNIESVNFTVWEGSTKIIDSQNGTYSDGNWTSPSILADEKTVYNYTIAAYDNVSESSTLDGNFSIGYKTNGVYMKTYQTSNPVRDVKVTYYGNLSSQTVSAKANTSGSSVITVQNDTWTDISAGNNITLHLELQSDGTSTPNITGYNLTYKTDYKSSGYMISDAQDFGKVVKINQVDIDEDQPSNTNVTYEYRTGSDATPPTGWSSWELCLDSCKTSLPENQYFQYRVNISGTSSKTGTLKALTVKYG